VYGTRASSPTTVPGVVAVAPFVINPMMVTHDDRTATGVLLKGVDPELMPKVLDLPREAALSSRPSSATAADNPPTSHTRAFEPHR